VSSAGTNELCPPELKSGGICVFADTFGGGVEPVFAELLSAARHIAETTGEPVGALLVAEDIAGPLEELKGMDIDRIYAAETRGVSELGDDARSAVTAEILRRVSPSCVLIPANDAGRSLFPRVAVKLNTGLTADCTELAAERRLNAERREDGYFIRQNKPSFGGNVSVSIVHREGHLPQLITIREGVYKPHRGTRKKEPGVTVFEDIPVLESAVSLLEVLPCGGGGDDILAADVVVVAGRGALNLKNELKNESKNGEDGGLGALRELAKKIGGVLGGTRPLADEGLIPFENQIGQTGRTIRPEICLSFGVSGAIQHTEGIKDTKLFVAVNNDPNAPIFHAADYGAVSDMKEIVQALLSAVEGK
jgi:electron transfer flavoprotein alpha subunit